MLIAVICLLFSCAKEELVQPEPTVENTLRTGDDDEEDYDDIDGVVLDDNDNPEDKIEVQLDTEDGGYIATDYTDSNGRYEFTGLSTGNYQVRVRPNTGNEEVYDVSID